MGELSFSWGTFVSMMVRVMGLGRARRLVRVVAGVPMRRCVNCQPRARAVRECRWGDVGCAADVHYHVFVFETDFSGDSAKKSRNIVPVVNGAAKH